MTVRDDNFKFCRCSGKSRSARRQFGTGAVDPITSSLTSPQQNVPHLEHSRMSFRKGNACYLSFKTNLFRTVFDAGAIYRL